MFRLLSDFFFVLFFFFFNDTATTEIYTLSLHDALPIFIPITIAILTGLFAIQSRGTNKIGKLFGRSEEHTSELQSHSDLVCRLLLEKKKKEKLKRNIHDKHIFSFAQHSDNRPAADQDDT